MIAHGTEHALLRELLKRPDQVDDEPQTVALVEGFLVVEDIATAQRRAMELLVIARTKVSLSSSARR